MKNLSIYLKKKGQTAVEYMLIIAVIVTVIFALGKVFRTQFQELTTKIFGKIGSKIENQSDEE